MNWTVIIIGVLIVAFIAAGAFLLLLNESARLDMYDDIDAPDL